jgi:hypothetical protein
MNISTRQALRFLWPLAFLGTVGAWAYYTYSAGCLADLKGGSWGNPQLALEAQLLGVSFGIAACALLGAFLSYSPESSTRRRAVQFIVGMLSGVLVMLGVGYFIEDRATQACAPIRSGSVLGTPPKQ